MFEAAVADDAPGKQDVTGADLPAAGAPADPGPADDVWTARRLATSAQTTLGNSGGPVAAVPPGPGSVVGVGGLGVVAVDPGLGGEPELVRWVGEVNARVRREFEVERGAGRAEYGVYRSRVIDDPRRRLGVVSNGDCFFNSLREMAGDHLAAIGGRFGWGNALPSVRRMREAIADALADSYEEYRASLGPTGAVQLGDHLPEGAEQPGFYALRVRGLTEPEDESEQRGRLADHVAWIKTAGMWASEVGDNVVDIAAHLWQLPLTVLHPDMPVDLGPAVAVTRRYYLRYDDSHYMGLADDPGDPARPAAQLLPLRPEPEFVIPEGIDRRALVGQYRTAFGQLYSAADAAVHAAAGTDRDWQAGRLLTLGTDFQNAVDLAEAALEEIALAEQLEEIALAEQLEEIALAEQLEEIALDEQLEEIALAEQIARMGRMYQNLQQVLRRAGAAAAGPDQRPGPGQRAKRRPGPGRGRPGSAKRRRGTPASEVTSAQPAATAPAEPAGAGTGAPGDQAGPAKPRKVVPKRRVHHVDQARRVVTVKTEADLHPDEELLETGEWRLEDQLQYWPQVDGWFPWRDPDNPLYRVWGPFADADGRLGPNVAVREVKLGPPRYQELLRGMVLHGDRWLAWRPDLPPPTVFDRLAQDVQRLVAATLAGPQVGRRVEARNLSPSDLPAHEQVLVNQYGVFLTADMLAAQGPQRPLLSNGLVLGLYAGAVLDDDAAVKRWKRKHPNYPAYTITVPRPGTGSVGMAAEGYAGTVAFANTRVVPGRTPVRDRSITGINAMFVPFQVELTDPNGQPHRMSIMVLAGLDNLYGQHNPSGMVIADYGDPYLTQLRPPPPVIKPDPNSPTEDLPDGASTPPDPSPPTTQPRTRTRQARRARRAQ